MPEPSPYAGMVVAIGTSEAAYSSCKELLGNLEPDGHTTFVLAATLPVSRALQLMERYQGGHSAHPPRLRLTLAEQGAPLVADTLFLAPPGSDVTVENGLIALRTAVHPTSSAVRVDALLRSVAASCGERAVALLVGEPGAFGRVGLRAVRAAGGLTIALRSADPLGGFEEDADRRVECGLVDLSLPLSEVSPALRRYRDLVDAMRERAAQPGRVSETGAPQVDDGGLERLGRVLDEDLGFDLRVYKQATVKRRVLRRMSLGGFDDFASYLAHVESDPEEPQRLMYDLLINVTDFFRDGTRFRALRELVVEPLVVGLPAGSTVRVWVPGCASGEEAYSIGMDLLDVIEDHGKDLSVRIFATDVDSDALAVARAGTYSPSSVAALPEGRLARHFELTEAGGYRVSARLRGLVSFALHDLTKDPPFARMHLVSCRNVLIYLTPRAQRSVLRLLHFALDPDGYLFLSASESVGSQTELFTPVSKAGRIYRKVGVSRLGEVTRWPGRSDTGSRAIPVPIRVSRPAARPAAGAGGDELRRALLTALAPPCIVVGEAGELLYSHGDLAPFLQIPEGEGPRLDLSAVRSEIATRTRAAIYKCRRSGNEVVALSSFDGGAPHRVRIAATPLEAVSDSAVLVTFERLPDDVGGGVGGREPHESGDHDALIEQLEGELQATRDDLRTTVEELESSNEDLRSSMEESMSMNEELQAANEELEATTEELRSVNEELSSVNALLREKVEEVERASDDIHNFFASTKVATVFLDDELRVKRFTPAASDLLGLDRGDIGRRIGALGRDLLQTGLAEEAKLVLEHLSSSSTELRTPDRRWITRKVLPYRTEGRRIEGIVVTYADVTALKDASERLARQEHRQGVLARIGLHALRDTDPQVLMDQVVREVQQTLNTDFCKILELQPGGDCLLLRSGVGWRPGLVGSVCVSVGPDSQAGFTLSTGDSILVEDLRTERRFSGPELLVEHGVRAGISAIIREGEMVYGVIGAHSQEPSFFDQEDARFLRAVASVVGSALSRHLARVRVEIELEVAHVLGEAKRLDEALDLVLERVGRRLHARVAEVWWPSEERTRLQRGTLWLHPSMERERALRYLSRAEVAVGEGLIGRVFSEDVAIWGTDAGDPTLVVRRAASEALGLPSGVGFPIAVGREVIGVVIIASSRRIFADEVFLSTLRSLGRALGAFLTRTEIEDRARRLAAITESAHDAILSYDLDGTIIEWLPGAERLFGYSAEELKGTHIHRIVPDDLREQLWTINERICRGEVLDAYETTRLHKDGKPLDVSVRSSPVIDPDGKVIGISSADRDVTRQKEMERSLREASRQKDEFLAMLGHELRNPLATIRSAAQFLELLDLDDARVRRIQSILGRQTEHMARLVDGLLDISRVASGKIDLQREVLDLGDLCRQVVEDARERANELRVTIELDVPLSPIWVSADRVRLSQVVDNLVANAIKYTGDGGLVTVGARSDGEWANLVVRDTGIGIEPDLLPHVFDAFRQSPQTLDRAAGGIGLGLALVRTLTELHGGRVSAHSDGVGRGAEFRVKLRQEVEPAGRLPSGPYGSLTRRILIIEDNVDAAEMLEQVLALSGHEVALAHDGPTGLRRAVDYAPDVVLCDIGLPGELNGFEVARAVRADARLARLRLIAVSGYGRPEDKAAATEAGFDAHLTKPIDVATLERFLSE